MALHLAVYADCLVMLAVRAAKSLYRHQCVHKNNDICMPLHIAGKAGTYNFK